MKLIAKTDARYIKAAMVCQAYQDIRYYLNGVHLSKSGEVQSTDGHTGFYVEDKRLTEMDESVIVAVFSAIPPKARDAEFLYDDHEDVGVIRLRDHKGKRIDKTIGFRIIEGQFPDFARIKKRQGMRAEQTGFNAKYLARLEPIAKALGIYHQCVAMELGGALHTSFFDMTTSDGVVATYLLMPVRL